MIAEADALSEGQVSGAVEGTDGQYYVIRLDKEFDEDATANKKQEIVSQRQSDHYTEVCDGYKKDAEWKVDDKVWKNVTFIGNQYTIATEQADTETEAVTDTENSVTPDNAEPVTETATESVQ